MKCNRARGVCEEMRPRNRGFSPPRGDRMGPRGGKIFYIKVAWYKVGREELLNSQIGSISIVFGRL